MSKVLIVEPHPDDMLLSLGGFMLNKYFGDNVELYTISVPSKYNKEDSSKLEDILGIKVRRNQHVQDLIFIKEEMGAVEKFYKKPYDLDIAYEYHNRKCLDAFSTVIQHIIEVNPDLLVMPLGIQHPMHQFVYRGLSAVNVPKLYYADMPYFNLKATQEEVFAKLSNKVLEKELKITNDLRNRKFFIFMKVYPSQWRYSVYTRTTRSEYLFKSV